MPTKFDFLSPGVQLREIDQSQVPETPENPGIMLIGRARSGPAMKPIRVRNMNDFVDIFGNPIDGVRQDDPWRQGNTGAPNYAAYAAQAYLAAGVGPVNYIRLLGKSKDGNITDKTKRPGWSMGSSFGTSDVPARPGPARVSSNASAFGLFIIPSGSQSDTAAATCTLTVAGTASILTDQQFSLTSSAGTIYYWNIDIDLAGATATGSTLATNKFAIGFGNNRTGVADTAVQIKDSINAAASGIFTATDDGAGVITITQDVKGMAGNRAQGAMTLAGGSAFTNWLGGATTQEVTGCLAAIIYASGSAMGISGSWVSGSDDITSALTSSLSASTLMKGNDASYGVKLGLSSSVSGEATNKYFNVNFTDYNNNNYIRNQLNVDPTKFYNDTNYGESNVSYFLGETFDVNVNRLSGGGGASDTWYFMAGLGDVGTANYDDFHQELAAAKSSWFIGQRPSQKYLFRLVALDDGEEFQNNYYCKIKDIRLPTTLQPNGSFTLQLMRRADNCLSDAMVEEYTNLSLDSDSPNYIVKRIGDMNQTWNASEEKYVTTGLYPNMSNYFYVEMATNSGVQGSDVPVGFLGPYAPAAVTITAAENQGQSIGSGSAWIHGSSSIALGNYSATASTDNGRMIAGWPMSMSNGMNPSLNATIPWPSFGMTTSGSKLGSQDYSYLATFGLRHVKSNSLSNDKSFNDIARRRANINPHITEGSALSTGDFYFTLEDIVSSSAGATTYYWNSGSYDAGNSIVAENSLSNLIDTKKIKKFAVPFFGAADGIDVRYADPFSNDRLAVSGDTYQKYTVDQALEMCRDPEMTEYEIIASPGLVDATLVNKMTNIATERGDALAVVDIKGIFQPKTDNGGSEQAASQSKIISQLNLNYLIDSSYACTYFPNIIMGDTLNGNNTKLKAPPSVAGIGAIAQSDAASSPWFAPAGFNRGGLGKLGGNAGPIVVGTVDHLTKDNRDVLYEANVNPIARFPATGDTVIFGQKTLQQTASALDRINVRRMMIYLKRHIGAIADTILFDQNVRTTWLRFKTRAEAVLSEIKAELGITEYKLVLDETTTTADLIDRNIMYAKVYVKPARSIEFIAVDFIITRSGVEF